MDRKLQIGDKLYPFPDTGDLNWGQDVYNWAAAITNAVNTGGGGSGGTSFTVGTGLNLTAGVLGISDAGVDTDQLADEAVVASKLAQSSVTQNKLSNGSVSADKIGVNAVTEEKLNITNTGIAGQVLSYAGANNFTWVAASEAGVEDLSGVRGGSGITVTHTQSNEIATVAVNESIQNRLIPTGGTANQFLTRQSDDPNTFDWTTLDAGQGLLLENGTFSIPDEGISYKMLGYDVSQSIFAGPIDNVSITGAHASTTQYDFYFFPNTVGHLMLIPRDTTRTYVNISPDGATFNRTWDDSDATSEYGVAVRERSGLWYRPVISGTTITHFRAFGRTTRSPDNDITLETPIPGVDSPDTSFVFSNYNNHFYFLNNNNDIYRIRLDGDVARVQPNIVIGGIPSGLTMQSMGAYLCFYDKNNLGGPLTVTAVKLLDTGNFYRIKRTFIIGRPANVTGDAYTHYNLTMAQNILYTFTGVVQGFTEETRLMSYNGSNGLFELQYHDLFESTNERYVPVGGDAGQILAKTTDSFYDTEWIDPPSSEIDDDSLGPDKLNIANPALEGNRAILSYSSDTQFQYLQVGALPQFFSNHSISFNKLEIAEIYVDNAGSIDPRRGEENLALVFKRQSGLGSPNSEWVPTNLDTIFQLNSAQIGLDDNPNKQHNYGLEFKPGAIKQADILAIDDLENLLGITFIQNPAILSNGNPLRPRLTTPWFSGDLLDNNGDPVFALDVDDVKFTVPRKRTAQTRGITHFLVKAGRVSGVDNTTTRTEAINAIQNHNNTYNEIIVPLSTAYAENNAAGNRPGFDRYNILFADNVTCAIEGKIVPVIPLSTRDTASAHSYTSSPCLLYTSPSPRDRQKSRMPSSA